MQTNFNLGALKVIQDPISEYLREASQKIEAVLSGASKDLHEDVADLITKTEKALNMVGVKGLSQVLHGATLAIASIKQKNDDDHTVSVLQEIQGVLKRVPPYITNLIEVGEDHPHSFFASYKKLMQAADKEFSVKDLFFPRLKLSESVNPDLEVRLEGKLLTEQDKEDLLDRVSGIKDQTESLSFDLIKKISSGELLTQTENSVELATLRNLLNDLQELELGKEVYILTGLQKTYLNLIQALKGGDAENYLQSRKDVVKSNINRIKNSVGSIEDDLSDLSVGEYTSAIRVRDEDAREIILELILLWQEFPYLSGHDASIHLRTYFNTEDVQKMLAEDGFQEFMQVEASEEVVTKIENLFLNVKDNFGTLTTLTKGSDEFAEMLTKISVDMKQFSIMMGEFKDISPLVGDLGMLFFNLKKQEVDFNTEAQKEISLSLVLIGFYIDNFIKSHPRESVRQSLLPKIELERSRLEMLTNKDLVTLQKTQVPSMDEGLVKQEATKTQSNLFTHVQEDLSKIETELNTFIKNNGEGDIASIFKPLQNMKGVFAVVGKPAVANIIDKIKAPWEKVVNDGDVPSADELRESVFLVGGLSLLVKAYIEENESAAETIYSRLMKMHDKGVEQQARETPPAKVPVLVEEAVAATPSVAVQEEVPVFAEEDTSAPVFVQDVSLAAEDSPTITIKTDEPQAVGGFVEFPEDEELAEVFLGEAQEAIDAMADSFAALDVDLNDKEELTNVRRYFHTLKGSGRMVGLEFFGEAAWIVEQTLNKCLSGELVFTPELFAAIKGVREKLLAYVLQMTSGQRISVDLPEIKSEFLAFNPNMTNHVSIPIESPQVATLSFAEEDSKEEETSWQEEPVQVEAIQPSTLSLASDDLVVKEFETPAPGDEPTVQVEEDVAAVVEDDKYIYIDGERVSRVIFESFQEEAQEHVREMKLFCAENGFGSVALPESFMRSAHTLGSISSSVNLKKFSQLAVRIEKVALAAIEREVDLEQGQMSVVRNAVEGLEFFMSAENESKGEDFFRESIEALDKLKDEVSLVEEQTVVESAVVEQPAFAMSQPVSVDVESLKAEIKQDLKDEILESLRSELREMVRDEVSKAVADIEVPEATQTIDQESIQEAVHESVYNQLKESLKTVLENFKDLKKDYQSSVETTNNLAERIASLPSDDRVSKMEKDIRVIASKLKKATGDEKQQSDTKKPFWKKFF